MRPPLRFVLDISLILVPGLTVAHFIPHLGWGLIVTALVFKLFRHQRHLTQLEDWSRTPSPAHSLEGDGQWDEVFSRLHRHERTRLDQLAEADSRTQDIRRAFEALPDGILLIDTGLRIEWANRSASQLFGLRLPEDIGQPVNYLIRAPGFVDFLSGFSCDPSPENSAEGCEPASKLASKSDPDPAPGLIIRTENTLGRVLSVHQYPYSEHKRLLQISDITQLDRLDKTRRDFVANVSHELRTPLTVLSGFIETLQEVALTPEQQINYLGLMQSQSARMQNLLDDLLKLSSLEAAPDASSDVTVSVIELAENLLRDASILSAGRHKLSLNLRSQMGIAGEESGLRSALGNLVSNAVRYTPEGGQITLGWEIDATGHGHLSVTDTGIGIAQEHLPRLTERFYRVDKGRSRDTGGTGLGLAIVKHALARHQARLDIRSHIGTGSTFTAVFPPSRLRPSYQGPLPCQE